MKIGMMGLNENTCIKRLIIGIIAFFVIIVGMWLWIWFSPKSEKSYSDMEQAAGRTVLYLYPEHETDITVKLGSDEDVLVSYPEYGGGWFVKAQPDGTLMDKSNREYDYLYWEFDGSGFEPDFSEGFCVRGSDTAAFLEEQLAYMRLSDSEVDDFITYWLPRMQGNAYNLISFQFEDYDGYEKLDIDPAPDVVLKVFMAWKPLDKSVDIKLQALPGVERYGFTVVECGGMECK